MYKDQVENIRCTILPELEKEDVELVDIELKGRVGSQILRVFVDTPDGINLDRCAKLSRIISDVLDIKDPIAGKYILEVSSPGLDRPLNNLRDFQRKIGHKVRIIYQHDGKSKTLEGIIKKVDENQHVKINVDGDEHRIPLNSIRKAKILLKW